MNSFCNYSAHLVGREKPMRLRCARIDAARDAIEAKAAGAAPFGPALNEFAYGICVEKRPSFDEEKLGAGKYWTYLASHPMVSFGFSRDGRSDPSQAEIDKRLDPEKLPLFPSWQARR